MEKTAPARRCEALVVVGTGVPADCRARAEEAVLDVVECRSEDEITQALEELWRRGMPPPQVGVVTGDEDEVRAVIDDQVARRRHREPPHVDPPSDWRWEVDGLDPEHEHADEALLTVADGRIGVTGAPLAGHPSARPTALVGGLYDGEGAESRLLSCPVAVTVPAELAEPAELRRVLDVRAGLLVEQERTTGGEVTAVRFASLTRPGAVVLRASGGRHATEDLLVAPTDAAALSSGATGDTAWMRVRAGRVGVVAAATSRGADEAAGPVDRFACYLAGGTRCPDPGRAVAAAGVLADVGFDHLLAEHRRAWAARWEDADVAVAGDADLQRALRLSLFHMMASAPSEGEGAVGARGLTGHGYRGHVFWDADAFVLPFFAATHGASARAMLTYRLRRLDAARDAARESGRAGARFPWESAATGRDVTPTWAYDRSGRRVDIRTGAMEEHIVADVAWAASTYVAWTGDDAFARTAGRRLLVETARYWASRIELDGDGTAHIRGVIGPDEYHENVDDDVFTNVMARWNLRQAVGAVAATPAAQPVVDDGEAEHWTSLADALVDGYDPVTGRHEQFAGFDDLEPLVLAEIVPRRPIAADILMGAERVRATQVIKQPAVLMAHHLVPDEMPPGSLAADLAHYEPRTAHGSSLSPGVHAVLLARVGKLDAALSALEITSHIDTLDLTGTTAAGVHLATAGALWQAMVLGFAGVRPSGGTLAVDPHVPAQWGELEVRVRFRGTPVRIRCSSHDVDVRAARPVPVKVRGTAATAGPLGLTDPEEER